MRDSEPTEDRESDMTTAEMTKDTGVDYSDDMATFGDRLATARELRGLTPKQLAQRLGIKLETLENWENDRSEPRANKLQMVAGILNVSIIWLMSGQGDVNFPDTADPGLADDLLADIREIRELQADLNGRLARLERKLLALDR